MRVSDLKKFFQGKSIAITGGASFIGSHLAEKLVNWGAEVRVADNLSTGRLTHLQSVINQIQFFKGDLRDSAFSQEFYSGADILFHLAAAHGGRGFIDSHPIECLGNLGLDHEVFTRASQAKIQKIVFASSACVYPVQLQEEEGRHLREEDAGFAIPGGAFADGEYGWAKLMGERQLLAFHRSFGIDAICCRIFTAYGPRENDSHAIIALLIRALRKSEPFEIWGDGKQTRNFTYVDDTVMGLLLSAANLSGFEVINIGREGHDSVANLAKKIFQLVDWSPRDLRFLLDKPVGPKFRSSDNSKARLHLGWEPSIGLEQGISLTIPSIQIKQPAARTFSEGELSL